MLSPCAPPWNNTPSPKVALTVACELRVLSWIRTPVERAAIVTFCIVAYEPRDALKLLPSKLLTFTPMLVFAMVPSLIFTDAFSGTFQTVTPSEAINSRPVPLMSLAVSSVLPIPAVMFNTWIPRHTVPRFISFSLLRALIVLLVICHGATKCPFNRTPTARALMVFSSIP